MKLTSRNSLSLQLKKDIASVSVIPNIYGFQTIGTGRLASMGSSHLLPFVYSTADSSLCPLGGACSLKFLYVAIGAVKELVVVNSMLSSGLTLYLCAAEPTREIIN